jgi:hypothetical protein
MKAIVDIITKLNNKVVLMMDANTVFEITDNKLLAFTKDADKSQAKVEIPLGSITVSGAISTVPTTNKMRGTHTAQLNKFLVRARAPIDHVLVLGPVTEPVTGPAITRAYIAQPDGNLMELKNPDTLTTPSVSITDHALVVSTFSDGSSYATFNIKGGNPFDKAWAEFVPDEYFSFFNDPAVKTHIDEIMSASFAKEVGVIKGKNYVSDPMFEPFNFNFANEDLPLVEIKERETVQININGTLIDIVKNASDQYVMPIIENIKPIHVEFIEAMVTDLNKVDKKKSTLACRQMFLEKGYLLLKFWYNVQKDTRIIKNGESLNSIFAKWYANTTRKISIYQMIRRAKEMYPNMKVMGIQEMPLGAAGDALKAEIESRVHCIVHMNNFEIKGNTRGAIIEFK